MKRTKTRAITLELTENEARAVGRSLERSVRVLTGGVEWVGDRSVLKRLQEQLKEKLIDAEIAHGNE